MFPLSAVACFVLLAVATATNVLPCKGRSAEGLSESITLTPCKGSRCLLKKGTTENIEIVFTPEKQINELKNHVTAEVFGLELPFVGVDGYSVCDKIFTANGDKVSCPLKERTEYIYRDSFPILNVYPSTTLKVHWALQAGERDVVCFELPTRISS